jgi:hypothetical protein
MVIIIIIIIFSVNSYPPATLHCYHDPEDHNINIHRRKIIKYYIGM